jgi:hypothetical protein
VAEWKPNIDRLVRSAMSDERYCSYILDVLHSTQYDMTLRQLTNFWERAKVSDLTVHEFISKERK